MRTRTKKTIGIAFIAASIFAVISCEKEKKEVETDLTVEKRYPTEITVDNWEEFVYAPDEVLQKIDEKEMAERKRTPYDGHVSDEFLSGDRSSDSGFGYVQGYSGGWMPFNGVYISTNTGCDFISNDRIPVNYYIGCETGSMCMEYITDVYNGVSVRDLVSIRKHQLGIKPFTEPREFLAADVNRDGEITDADILDIIDIILGRTLEFPNSDNVIFVIEVDYNYAQDEINLTGTWDSFGGDISSNACFSVYYKNRRGIKTGDVTGNFSF